MYDAHARGAVPGGTHAAPPCIALAERLPATIMIMRMRNVAEPHGHGQRRATPQRI